ncbi:hypothetical protein NX722_25965 [Endozoicomonas gorgoniicola]|uniref:Uncharacterized protein n=1 Tax=Endozoicomonas gorgoniicola TaxID=1234144 RepID=A0ABT3MP09_9GAMM|nr:hypothetical protein [Endozoicomonas gorgoniicola]MCW7551108.1 hypothetical protein [Endozoicomonas gorgoniicola]MCW7556013.1 hypothetical protein [Endozoicomonas gorgoniicola]
MTLNISSHSDDNEKNALGRPRVGITEQNSLEFCLTIRRWIDNHRLDRWLAEEASYPDAVAAYDHLPSNLNGCGKCEEAKALDLWCLKWLSQAGWQRLQANVRQQRLNHGSSIIGKDGQPINRPRRKAIQLEEETKNRLAYYARKRNMTINEAIRDLLDHADP